MPPRPEPADGPRARGSGRAGRWLAARTLRGRLVAGLLALLALACFTVGAVTYAHLRTVLISGLDQELATAILVGQRPGSWEAAAVANLAYPVELLSPASAG